MSGMFNHEGYPDPTAYYALLRIERSESHRRKHKRRHHKENVDARTENSIRQQQKRKNVEQ